MLKKTFKSCLSIEFFSFYFVAVWIRSAPLHVLATAEDDLENFRNTNPKGDHLSHCVNHRHFFVLIWAVLIDKNELKATEDVCFGVTGLLLFFYGAFWSKCVSLIFFSSYNKDYAKAW